MTPDRRQALAVLAAAVTPALCRAADAAFDPERTPLADLAARLRAGTLTARQAADVYLARIAAIDAAGPTLRAVIEVNPDARAIADALDRKAERGPLHGVPILVKDNVATADKMETTAGSLALVGHKPKADAFLVRRLREAGAVVLGKANLSEWANFRSDDSTSGWSSRGGLTRNPHALDRNACGSSSGSAVAVAAGLCAAAVGTETNGSIVSPASANGVVGLKPTVGLISRSGIIPISSTQDTAGPMARSVRDAAILLNTLAGIDPDDPVTLTQRGKVPADFTATLNADGLAKRRVGVLRNAFRTLEIAKTPMDAALKRLAGLGVTLVEVPSLPSIRAIGGDEMTVLLYEFKAGVNAYLKSLGPDGEIQTLADVIRFNERNRKAVMPHFGQELLERAEATTGVSDPKYVAAAERCRKASRDDGIDAALKKYTVDALVGPTMGPTCVTDLVLGDRFVGGVSTAPAAAGYPHLTVPAGGVRGLPVGLSLFASAWAEPLLLQLGHAFEAAGPGWGPPAYRASVGA